MVGHNAIHAGEHTDGTDDIQTATAGQKGLMTAAAMTALESATAAKHTQNTDAYLTTPVTQHLHVDGARIDVYVENGSLTKPFKTIAAAELVATATSTITIHRMSAHYIEDLTLNNAAEYHGLGDPIIEGATVFSGNPKHIHGIQFDGSVLCNNVSARFMGCESTTLITISGTAVVFWHDSVSLPASGKCFVITGGQLSIADSAATVIGDIEAIDQSGGLVTVINSQIIGSSATIEIIKSSGGQIMLNANSIQNLGGGPSVDVQNGATTSPNIISNLVSIGNVICGTAVTVIEGITFASGALSGSNLVYRPGSMIGNVPAGGIVATNVQAAINELDVDVVLNTTHRTSDGSDHTFIDQSVISGASPTFDATNISGIVSGKVDQLHILARKASPGTILKDTPVYPVSYNVGGWLEVEEADASNPAKMPAIAVTEIDLTNSSTEFIVVAGNLTGIDTSTPEGGTWAVGDQLYVASSGGLTKTKPTGTNEIQKMAEITRINASNGSMEIFGAGRTNDLPNIAENAIWKGDSNGVPQVFQHNYSATVNPTINDDSGDGYEVGSEWGNVTDDIIWKCIDASVGAAVWLMIGKPDPLTIQFPTRERDIDTTGYLVEASMFWQDDDFGNYGTRLYEFFLEDNGSTDNVSVQLYDLENVTVLGSLTGITTDGLKSFTITKPVSDTIIQLRVKKDTNLSTDWLVLGGMLDIGGM